ncbi:hypothetical protein GCM10022625_46630 [Deinococcus aetherius]
MATVTGGIVRGETWKGWKGDDERAGRNGPLPCRSAHASLSYFFMYMSTAWQGSQSQDSMLSRTV